MLRLTVSDKLILRKVDKTNHPDSPDFIFWCPGCQHGHGVWVTVPNKWSGGVWTFNGNMEKPTFEPSLLIESRGGDEKRCHVIVTDGVLNYCTDSEHALAGQSVPMEAF